MSILTGCVRICPTGLSMALTIHYLLAASLLLAAEPLAMRDRLKQEIATLERKIGDADRGHRSAVEQLQDIERTMELRRRLVQELEQEATRAEERLRRIGRKITALERDIAHLSDTLVRQESEMVELRRELAGRVRDLYFRRPRDRLMLLISTRRASDMARRRKYWESVERFDRQRIEELTRRREEVSRTRSFRADARKSLEVEQAAHTDGLNRLSALLRERRNEQEALARQRREQQDLVRRIEADQVELRKLLEERRRSLLEIEREIARLQEAPRTEPPPVGPGGPFRSLAGKLPWPSERRKVIEPFGPSRHPRLGTTTLNPGIDIEGVAGERVRAVAPGRVTRITWLRGFGNTVIIDHGESFYTVYARLGEIEAVEGSLVSGGQPIGRVGDTGGATGLHFEVWSKREKQNPLDWLAR